MKKKVRSDEDLLFASMGEDDRRRFFPLLPKVSPFYQRRTGIQEDCLPISLSPLRERDGVRGGKFKPNSELHCSELLFCPPQKPLDFFLIFLYSSFTDTHTGI